MTSTRTILAPPKPGGTPPAPAGFAGYVRQARRIRAAHGRDVVRLHHALRDLAGEANARPVDRPDLIPTSPAHAFARLVAAAIEGRVLRYSARLGLLRKAAGMGIKRFEANLIIAAVEHRTGLTLAKPPRPSRRPPGWVFAFVLIEGAIGLGMWWVVHR